MPLIILLDFDRKMDNKMTEWQKNHEIDTEIKTNFTFVIIIITHLYLTNLILNLISANFVRTYFKLII